MNVKKSAYSQRTYIENTTGALVPERIDLSGRSPKSVYIVSKKYNLWKKGVMSVMLDPKLYLNIQCYKNG